MFYLALTLALTLGAIVLIFCVIHIVRWFRSIPNRILRALDGNYNAACMRAEEVENARNIPNN